MAKYKVLTEVEVKNCTVKVEPADDHLFPAWIPSGILLSFKMLTDPQVSRSILLSDQDVDNLFAAIREVQRLRNQKP